MYNFKNVNSKGQGDIGVGAAISYFSSRGNKVLIPLSDNQPYDLVIDDSILKKIQVKTSGHKGRYGKYMVALSTCGGNKSGNKRKTFDNTQVDLVFILLEDGKKYLIPSNVIEAKNSIQIGKKYDKFLI